jgi:hypothetical protein
LRVFIKDNQAIVGESYGYERHVYCTAADASGLLLVADLIAAGWVEIPVVYPARDREGRVTIASVKDFQVVCDQTNNRPEDLALGIVNLDVVLDAVVECSPAQAAEDQTLKP